MPPKNIKGKKKGGKKKIQDAFLKKEWYVVKVPSYMPTKNTHYRVGYTPAKKGIGGAKKQLDQRTFVINLADLHYCPVSKEDDQEFVQTAFDREKKYSDKKFKFIAEEIYGQQILTQWHGMEITRHKRCSFIRKWHTMIQCFVDAKTTDGYVLRVKALAFTKRQMAQVKKNCYAKHSQVKQIRARMRDIIRNHISSEELKTVVRRLQEGNIGRDIKKSCQLIFPLHNCYIEKVKVMRKPKRDVARMMKLHDLSHAFDPLTEEELRGEEKADEEKKDAAEGDQDMEDKD